MRADPEQCAHRSAAYAEDVRGKGGISGEQSPRFVKHHAHLREVIGDATHTFLAEVANGDFPGVTYSYNWALN
jgi:ketopantoate hydroxymethyltransferase